MTRSIAPDELWHELRKAACAHLQAELDYERSAHVDSKWSVLCKASNAKTRLIREIVMAEQAKEQP